MKKVAIFDIDGTVFRSSLLIELTDALIQEGVFSSKVIKLYSQAYGNWLNRKGSYEEYIEAVVKEFIQKMDFDKIYGRIYEIDKQKRLTGNVLHLELINDKAEILKRAIEKEKLTIKGSVGVGDTESDIAFLKMVEKPICFNPNRKLYQHAKRVGWKIVVERKDVVYNL